MPAKTAEKRLLLPASIIIIALLLLWLLPPMQSDSFISFENSFRQSYPLGAGFACVSAGEIRIYSEDGALAFSETHSGGDFLASSDGETLALAFGESLRFYGAKGRLYELEVGSEILAIASSDGVTAVSSACDGFACRVTVYEGDSPRFTRYIAKAPCRTAAVLEGEIFLALGGDILALDIGGAEIAKFSVSGEITGLYTLKSSLIAETAGALCFYSADGELLSEFVGEFSTVRGFDDAICVMTQGAVTALGARGQRLGDYESEGGAPRFFGSGSEISLILGQKVIVLGEKMEEKYVFENKFVPQNVITYRHNTIVIWQNAAEIHRR